MLKVQRNRSLFAAAALGTLAAFAPAALGAVGERPSHGHHAGVSVYTHSSVGTIVIDGRRFRIDAHRPVWLQISRAFHRLGYHASYDHGRLHIESRYGRAPRIRWYTGSHAIKISRRHGHTVLRWWKITRDRHYRSGYDWRPHRSRGRLRPYQRRWCY